MANKIITKDMDLVGPQLERCENYYEVLFDTRHVPNANCVIVDDKVAIYDIHKRARNFDYNTIVAHKMKVLCVDDELEVEVGTSGDCYTDEDPCAYDKAYTFIRIEGIDNNNIEFQPIDKRGVKIKVKGGPGMHAIQAACKLISDAIVYQDQHIKEGDIVNGDW